MWPIYLCRRLIASVLYLTVRFGLPLHSRLVGYKCTHVGKCTFLAPPSQMRTILEGTTFLQTLDSKMFQQLTAERSYVFWYHPKRFQQCREFFSITDNFLLWGKEGVATCLVQSVLEFKLMFLPFEKTLLENREAATAARREIQKRMLSWMSEHAISVELVKQYYEIAKKCGAI